MPRPARFAWGAALLAALFGCAPTYGDAFLRAMAAGERAASAGRHEEAARAFDAAAEEALRVKDRDEARFLAARAYEDAGQVPQAQGAYEKLLAASPAGPRSARAVFELAYLQIDHGDADLGYAMLLDALRKMPSVGMSDAALKRLVRRELDLGGPERAAAWLRAEGPHFHGTELDQPLQYELARQLDDSGHREEARAAFVATAEAHPYPFGGLTDDAYWHAAEIDRALGRPQQAIDDLRKMLSSREIATMTGSYERPRFPEGQLRIGEIYRDDLHDHASARRELRRVADEHATSTLRDDALWAEARLAREDGDGEAACDAVKRLVKDVPDSRYASCSRELCPDAPLPSGARPCADYVRRDLAGGAGSDGDAAAP